MAIMIRILLLLLPVALVVIWLRYRAKKNSAEELTSTDIKNVRISLGLVIAALLVAGVSLRMVDESREPGDVYIPAYVVDGELVPGRFVPKDHPEAIERLKQKQAEELEKKNARDSRKSENQN